MDVTPGGNAATVMKTSHEILGNTGNNERMPQIPADRYTMIEKLGQGGMGMVVKATHAKLNKLVAIKVLNTNSQLDELSLRRFEVEAKAGGQLSHPNLVGVFDYGFTDDGAPYLVMEYVDGDSLQTYVEKHGPLSANLFITVFEQLLKALHYIHNQGIVHRDIKASNIMLQVIGDDLYAKLLDFGIAKMLGDQGPAAQQLTATGAIIGSPLYMSPEQCMGNETDSRSDLYSLGCVMYECISGRPPLLGDNALQTFFMHINEEPAALESSAGGDPTMRSITKLIHKCLNKKPSNRFQNCGELLKELSAIKNNQNPSAQTQPSSQLATPSAEHRRAGLATNLGQGEHNTANRWKRPDNGAEAQTSSTGSYVRNTASGELRNTPPNEPVNEISDRDIELQKLTAGKIRRHTEEVAPQPLSRSNPNSLQARALLPFVALALVLIAGMYFGVPKAVEFYQRQLADQEMSQADKSFALGQAHWAEAKTNYGKALEYAEHHNDATVKGKILTRLGRIELFQGELAQAEACYRKAIALLKPTEPTNRNLILDSLIGGTEALTRQRKYNEAKQFIGQAETYGRKWSQGAERKGDIMMAKAANAAADSKTEEAINSYEIAIAEYSKLETPPAPKLAKAWLESALACQKLGWTAQMQRRAEQTNLYAAKITDASIKADFQHQAGALLAATRTVPQHPLSHLPGGMPQVPIPIPVPTLDSLPSTGQPTTSIDVEVKRQEAENEKAKLEQIMRAQAFNAKIQQIQDENYKNVVQQLEQQNNRHLDGY
ncbi:MAG: serine/threonine-protein kinase [Candidatus Obscuribacterales bacterium]|nr:serine/threonine-protein kinase [Candidatus Obscuribacterales bacterium]